MAICRCCKRTEGEDAGDCFHSPGAIGADCIEIHYHNILQQARELLLRDDVDGAIDLLTIAESEQWSSKKKI